MANFNQAINWLRNNKKVRRPSWEEDSYWTLGKDETICWKIGINAHVHLNQVKAKDWEIYEEEQLKKINEDRRIKCIYCKQPIHIDNFAGVNKKGMFCGKTECLIKLAKELEIKK